MEKVYIELRSCEGWAKKANSHAMIFLQLKTPLSPYQVPVKPTPVEKKESRLTLQISAKKNFLRATGFRVGGDEGERPHGSDLIQIRRIRKKKKKKRDDVYRLDNICKLRRETCMMEKTVQNVLQGRQLDLELPNLATSYFLDSR
ncbi:hypothetical protein AVEN_219642-1 [Araneus ventricosus]|uniref:Uncharacterized protein n=1 Tax=Araneus ventricosus TaxID=182803 RepID=A0A4Y2NYD5_ARAVE|nr:hypothetical protein AVEN_219642-1 [Araneus ventricosus]